MCRYTALFAATLILLFRASPVAGEAIMNMHASTYVYGVDDSNWSGQSYIGPPDESYIDIKLESEKELGFIATINRTRSYANANLYVGSSSGNGKLSTGYDISKAAFSAGNSAGIQFIYNFRHTEPGTLRIRFDQSPDPQLAHSTISPGYVRFDNEPLVAAGGAYSFNYTANANHSLVVRAPGHSIAWGGGSTILRVRGSMTFMFDLVGPPSERPDAPIGATWIPRGPGSGEDEEGDESEIEGEDGTLASSITGINLVDPGFEFNAVTLGSTDDLLQFDPFLQRPVDALEGVEQKNFWLMNTSTPASSFTLSSPLPTGEVVFDLLFRDETVRLAVGETFDFTSYDPNGVRLFAVRGVGAALETVSGSSTLAGQNSDAPLEAVMAPSFLTSLTFTTPGAVRVYMTPITIPEPTSAALLGLVLLGGASKCNRRRQ